VTIQSPFIPNATFTPSAPGDLTQSALAEERDPYRTIYIVAVPFGTVPPTESDNTNPLLPAATGEAATYRAKLREYRAAEGGNPQTGPKAMLFGQVVTSDASLLQLPLIYAVNVPTLYVEWVVEAGPRLWIVRIVDQLHDGTTDLSKEGGFLDSLQALIISSDSLNNPSTLQPATAQPTTTVITPGLPDTGVPRSIDLVLPALLLIILGCLLLTGTFFGNKKRLRSNGNQ
jgi:hypothetical protein